MIVLRGRGRKASAALFIFRIQIMMARLPLQWKLLLAPIAAALCFAIYATYMAVVLTVSNNSLEDIRDVQRPALDVANGNQDRLDKIVDAFKNAVTAGESEPLDAAKALAEKVNADYVALQKVDQPNVGEIKALSTEFNAYFEKGLSLSKLMISKQAPEPQEFEAMAGALETYQKHLAAFRARVEKRFNATIADTTHAARMARILGFVAGAIVLAVALFLAWRVSSGIMAELGGEPQYVNHVMKEIAEGNLTAGLNESAPPNSVLAAARKTSESLREIMRTIRGSAEKVGGGAHEIAVSAESMATAAQAGSDAASSMSSAVEHMAESINHISNSARNTQENSSHSLELAGEGEKRASMAREEVTAMSSSISEAATCISSLVVRVNEIGAIAGVIKDIAAQTNLLALNAAIESARAGEQGRGFAVVADEVRGLAERTSAATVQIEQMIGGIQEETRQAVTVMEAVKPQVVRGVELVDSAASSLREIRQGASDTLEKVRDVALATEEQSSASNDISQQVGQIVRMVDSTSNSLKQTVATAGELERTAAQLNSLLSRFRV